jgi:GntR family transcriptional regulator
MRTIAKKLDHNSPVPLHRQIQGILRELIDSGTFNGGKLLPNEVELSAAFGVSRNTVRHAFNALVSEGLLERKRGVGTRISNKPAITTHLGKWHSFTRDMEAQGIELTTYDLTYEDVECDEELAGVFHIRQGRTVKRLQRVRGDAEQPFVVFESWFHPRIPLKDDQDFKSPLNDILEFQYHVIPVRSSEELQAVLADERIGNLLNIPKGSPVFFRKRLVYDMGNRIIEYNKCYYRHDKMTYSIEINRTV